jgi:hypothetical protein
MLNSINLYDKTYEEMMSEVLSRIPMYTSEWTNFNISDPGITILQNLTAFNNLQQNYINQVTDSIRRKLLKLLHFEPLPNRAARVLLEARTEMPLRLRPHMKFMAGDLEFETGEEIELDPWTISAIYSESDGIFRDLTYLVDREIRGGTEIFSSEPVPGMALYLILDGKPDTGKEIILYVHAGHPEIRNLPEEDSDLRFAEVSWQYYTAEGWREAEWKDGTFAFITDGEIRLKLSGEPAVFTGAPTEGYALRCVLKKVEYDIPPCLRSITANLFEVYQQSTRAASFRFNGSNRIVIDSELALYGYMFVYCREKKGGGYRAYKEYTGFQDHGRFYRKSFDEDGSVVIEFDPGTFGYGPGRGFGAVLVVCYSEETVLHRSLGRVFGYDDQMFDIEVEGYIIEEGFSLLVETPGEDGEPEYTLAYPGETDPDKLCYEIVHEMQQVKIRHPGFGVSCNLFLCDCRTTEGSGGNIRERNSFTPAFAGLTDVIFMNPTAGRGGTNHETVGQLRSRFVSDLKSATAAVRISDYEQIVKKTPGLCIHKVNAYYSEESNTVKIAVKPYLPGKYPRLSPRYARHIKAHLESKRLVTTSVEILEPTYVPIDAQVTVIVKGRFEDAKSRIEDILREELDFAGSERTFGDTVRFNDVYRKIDELDFVESVYSLSLIPRTNRDYELIGNDIRLGESCLAIPGRISVEMHTGYNGF